MNETSNKRKMKAIRLRERGGPENFAYEDIEIPQVSGSELLIKVCAAAITPTELTWNSSYTTRKGTDRLPVTPSFEVSGIVERKGKEVMHLREGDAVYGLLDFWRDGAAAQYVVADADKIALKPENLDHVAASSLTLSGLTAWQSLFEQADLSSDERVLIHGASGGVGSLAVQLAHWKGAHVIGTCSKSKTALVQSLGANEVIDYASRKFEEVVEDVDLIVDTVGGETLSRSWQVLKEGGTLVTVADDIDPEMAESRNATGISFLVEPNRNQLREIASLADSGLLKPVVSEVYDLKNAREAYMAGLSGHNTGKIVLKVSE